MPITPDRWITIPGTVIAISSECRSSSPESPARFRAENFHLKFASRTAQALGDGAIAADHGSTTRNHEVPRKKRSRTGTSSVPFPQRHRIKAKFISGKNISQIAREEARHWTTVKRIVEEKDVQEYVKDLRARFYGTLEGMLFAAVRYARDGKGGWLAYEMLKDSGVIPQRNTVQPLVGKLRDQSAFVGVNHSWPGWNALRSFPH